jgi:hypothetical protein
MESDKCHLGAIIVRDLSITVSNYRSSKNIQDYCKEQNVIGIANVDTRALTKVLRETGCLVGVITTDATKTDAELVTMAKGWTIVGKDLLSVVSCTEPYEWKDPTGEEWEFNAATAKATHKYHVSQAVPARQPAPAHGCPFQSLLLVYTMHHFACVSVIITMQATIRLSSSGTHAPRLPASLRFNHSCTSAPQPHLHPTDPTRTSFHSVHSG